MTQVETKQDEMTPEEVDEILFAVAVRVEKEQRARWREARRVVREEIKIKYRMHQRELGNFWGDLENKLLAGYTPEELQLYADRESERLGRRSLGYVSLAQAA
jgi:hypothetical protein